MFFHIFIHTRENVRKTGKKRLNARGTKAVAADIDVRKKTAEIATTRINLWSPAADI